MITHHKVSTFLIILQKLHASFYSHQRSHTNHPPYSSKIPAISPNHITVNRQTQLSTNGRQVAPLLRFEVFRDNRITANRITVNRLTANRPPSQLSNASSA